MVVRCTKCGERIFGGGRKCPDCGHVRSLADEVSTYLAATIRSRSAMRQRATGDTDARRDLWVKKAQR